MVTWTFFPLSRLCYFRPFPEQCEEDTSWFQIQDDCAWSCIPVGSIWAQGSFISEVRWETKLSYHLNLLFFFCGEISEN